MMKSLRIERTLIAGLLVGTLLVACGDDDGDTQSDAGTMPDAAVQTDAMAQPDAAGDVDGSVTTGEASDITVDLHTGNMFAYKLSDLTAHVDYTGTDWDVSVTKAMPDPPTYLLGPGVTGINLGNGTAFHAVNEAPESGYADDTASPIIGVSWQDGGSGTTGYQMTGNVYVLLLADGTYAKLEVLSAQGGIVAIRAYHQADGSRNLATAE